MAFILSFGQDGPDTEVNATESRSFIRSPIGFDPEDEIAYFLTVSFDFSISISGYELSFWVSANHLNGVEEDHWDGAETWFIKRSDRGLILGALLLLVIVLIQNIGPERVLMVAIRGTALPEKAVRKYLEINRVFGSMGYSVTESEPIYGNKCWLMERSGVV